jgi:NAD(P)-dependent dehydrogenase (short-subunit alcohol dehydrogenase family)
LNGCVVITGHLGGLGSALASQFIDAGYEVIGIDIDALEHASHAQIVFDLSTLIDTKAVSTMRVDLTKAIGSHPLIALINNAAVQHLGDLESLETGQFLESFHVNVMAPLNLARLLLPDLKQSHGTVININSIHARLTKPGFAPYSISKAAMAGLTRAMAVELGASIRVIEIRPAAISTPMLEAGFADQPDNRRLLDDFHPTGQIGSPGDIAQTVQQLVETDVDYLNGSVVNVDGGISHRLHDPS